MGIDMKQVLLSRGKSGLKGRLTRGDLTAVRDALERTLPSRIRHEEDFDTRGVWDHTPRLELASYALQGLRVPGLEAFYCTSSDGTGDSCAVAGSFLGRWTVDGEEERNTAASMLPQSQ